jgi:hypothetical protein
LAVLFIVAFESRGADFDSDWLLEDLTCEELVSGYNFEVEVLGQLVEEWRNCNAYVGLPGVSEDLDIPLVERVHCALLRKEGEFIQGMTNDIVAVHNAKPECGARK